MTSALNFLIEPLRQALFYLHNNLGLSWALAIIVLTIGLRLVLTPLTIKQYTSMRAMQKLQPKMKELQKKFKDDRQKLNEEIMKLYREHKVNPFGSCLPMLIQLPITLALYLMIRSSPLGPPGNGFLWISNINNPDLILVLIYIASQLASSLMLTTTTDKSQRMLMLGMPVFFGILIYKFPAGAILFWATSNILMVGQQLIVREVIKGREASAEPVEPAAPPPPPKKNGGVSHAKKSKSKRKRR